ncbi:MULTISPECIES: hypothetical protein [unclassified Mycobacterium]|uniref:hypothetical protein n=1 Tax=unclassified Mycobacterium TaxID=2642494 RepID=UPI000994433E|nr:MULTISPECIES: hypothetical protein [unclassified Mycobacterium]
MSTDEGQLHHICEVCGRDEVLTADDAFDEGWDYPPRMGQFGVVGPRICPNCPASATVWAAIMLDGYTADMLSEQQQATIARIAGEPDSILVQEDSS